LPSSTSPPATLKNVDNARYIDPPRGDCWDSANPTRGVWGRRGVSTQAAANSSSARMSMMSAAWAQRRHSESCVGCGAAGSAGGGLTHALTTAQQTPDGDCQAVLLAAAPFTSGASALHHLSLVLADPYQLDRGS
jgi:hypothetical protein